ncbi:MAG: glycosyltransferase [Phycisphaerae bacterium]|nr:glycosyltransferase [Phycisphaerae bacterium]
MPRICLNMIVKNESANLERCLSALAPHIDCYVICDTGSTDKTVELIERFFGERGIPGRVPRTTFRNFEQARNEALEAARSSDLEFDYLLLCDADMELKVDRPGFRDGLKEPVYSLVQRHAGGGLEYSNIRLVRRDAEARYRGVTHEYLDVGRFARPVLEGVWYLDHASGANRVTKYERDVALLTEALRVDPADARSVFYLANSYFDMGDSAGAIPVYERRIDLGGWSEEQFYSSYRIGLCHGRLGHDAEMIRRMLETFEKFPHRAEPLHALALHFQRQGQHRLAYHFAEIGSRILQPNGALFVEPEVYTWRLVDIMSVSLYWLKRPVEGAELSKRLLEVVPADQRPRVFKNLQFCEQALARPQRA